MITLTTKTGQIIINTQNEDDLKKWLTALQLVAFKEKTNTINRNSVIEEDNDLYCSSYGEGVFNITLIPTETSIKCKMEAQLYTLVLTSSEIQLKTFNEESILSKWPYRYVRKYGYRDGKFTFEAGRKCETGEGIFKMDHTNPQEIFRCMSAKMKSMKKLINGESVSSLDCGENQLNAALSMEPGSRSPLPPSPNNQHSSDLELSINHSHASLRGFLSSTDSVNNSITMVKNIPNKPPRKSMGSVNNDRSYEEENKSIGRPRQFEPVQTILIGNDNKSSSSTQIFIVNNNNNSNSIANNNIKSPELPTRNKNPAHDRDYECIESITDAWKTLGIDEVRHTEHISTPEEELEEFVWQRSKSQRENSRQQLNNNFDDDNASSECDESYDRLEFFGSNKKVSSGYKTIVPIIPPPQIAKKPQASDDYEYIGNPDSSIPDTHSCRLADDSYLGYGVLRKPSTPGPQVPTSSLLTTPDDSTNLMSHHRQYNGLDYAIVSKPKRV